MSTSAVPWIVLKFGGTSVSLRERWDTIAQVARERIEEGFRPLVVCSALSGISNALEKLLVLAKNGDYAELLADVEARHHALAATMGLDGAALLADYFAELQRLLLGISLIGEVSPRVHARVLAMGELMSTRLGAAYLNQIQVATKWCDAREMLQSVSVQNAGEHRLFLSASCDGERKPELAKKLEAIQESVVLTQGFIASDAAGETVLLGRGGSDTSAAYLAAGVGAARLEIWTDVPGMFTANPRDIPSARLLQQLHYDEAQELATMGAKILHPRCLPPVRAHRIPLHIKCLEHPELEGTVISADAPDAGAQVKAISAKTGITLVSMNTLGMWQQIGFLADIFAVFKQNGLSIDLVTTSEANVTVTLDPMANALEPTAVNRLLADLKPHCDARIIGPCAAVSLVGHNIRSILHRLAPALEVFEEQHIYLVSQAASDLNLTFVVAEDQANRIVRKLHSLLFRERTADETFGPTWRELFGEPRENTAFPDAWWRRRKDELLALADESPLYVYEEKSLQTAVDSLQEIEAVQRVFYAIKANSNPDILEVFYRAGIGFECVSIGELNHVWELFPDIEAERVLFTPNFAARDEYVRAFEKGAWVTLDNLHPVEEWPDVFRGRSVLVRVDPGQGRGHHKYVRTAGQQSKFGIEPANLESLSERARGIGLKVVGLHAHVGSGVRSSETWGQIALFLEQCVQHFPDVRILNLGGGLGVPERANQNALDLAELGRTLADFRTAHPQFELWLEPGRYLVAQAGVLLGRVTQLKQKGTMHYVGIDAGMNSLIRPALYGAYHEIVNLSRLDEVPGIEAEIVGPICESGDVLGHMRRLPVTKEGDVLLIATAGAYGRTMSSRYNLREPAGERFLR